MEAFDRMWERHEPLPEMGGVYREDSRIDSRWSCLCVRGGLLTYLEE